MDKTQRLFYDKPAEAWTEALPLGNGRLGAMAFGGAKREVFSLNEDTLWSGYPRDTNVDGAASHYRKSQEMIRGKRYAEAQRYIESTMLGTFSQSYLPLGDLVLEFDDINNIENYARELTLDDAVTKATFSSGGVVFAREAFVSYPDQALIFRLRANQPGQISFRMAFACQLRHEAVAQGGALTLSGRAPSAIRPNYVDDPNPIIYEEDEAKRGMRFCAVARVQNVGGEVVCAGGQVVVKGADEVVIQLTARTSFNGFDRQPYVDGLDERALCASDSARASEKTYDAMLRAHIEDYSALFGRVQFELGGASRDDLPTDVRLRQYEKAQDDNGLIALMFHFGRYLIIAASRKGSQPTNLQGIWNHHLRAPWSSNYTVNINTEMNYWPVEALGLPEMHGPLFDMIKDLMITGAKTADKHYGARGFVSHHNVDLWRLSTPVGENRPGSAVFAFWPMSFGWLCEHLFEHYLFTQDRAFLKAQALPAIRGAARFYLDVLAENSAGYLSITPATSPENSFLISGERVAVAESATMSNAIVREVLKNYLSALKILGIQESMADEARCALSKLHPFQIGSKGQLLEWEAEFEEAEPTHRHVSHLYALHPSRQITPEETPELAKACEKTLELRGDDGTGWSLGWKINFWARLRDGDHALRLIKRQLRFVKSTREVNYMGGGGTYANLFDAHPPFQIDGNYGACAGIAEMLLQSHGDEVLLLPALPSEWKSGFAKGLRAHGGLSVDIWFEEGKLSRAVISRIAKCDAATRVRSGARVIEICPALGESVEIR